MEILTSPGKGTTVRATFRLSHPDLKPMGDLIETIAILSCAHPQVQFVFDHRQDGAVVCRWDSASAVAGN